MSDEQHHAGEDVYGSDPPPVAGQYIKVAEGENWHIGGELGEVQFAELTMQEPPLTRLFRSLAGSPRLVTVNSLDGSTIKGRVTDVADKGTTVSIENGEHLFVFDIAAVCLVKLERAIPSEQ